MTKKPRSQDRFLLGCLLVSLCGIPLILYGLHTSSWSITYLQQHPGICINYGPAFWIGIYGVVLLFLGPILFFYRNKAKLI